MLNILWFQLQDLVHFQVHPKAIMQLSESKIKVCILGSSLLLLVSEDCIGGPECAFCTFRHLMMCFVPNFLHIFLISVID